MKNRNINQEVSENGTETKFQISNGQYCFDCITHRSIDNFVKSYNYKVNENNPLYSDASPYHLIAYIHDMRHIPVEGKYIDSNDRIDRYLLTKSMIFDTLRDMKIYIIEDIDDYKSIIKGFNKLAEACGGGEKGVEKAHNIVIMDHLKKLESQYLSVNSHNIASSLNLMSENRYGDEKTLTEAKADALKVLKSHELGKSVPLP